MQCRGMLGRALDEHELRLATHATTSVTVSPYTIAFSIVGTPSSGRGDVRISWTGGRLTAGSVVGGFDAKDLDSISGQLKVPEGTLSYDCGAVGGFM
jgi:hypothetical protein